MSKFQPDSNNILEIILLKTQLYCPSWGSKPLSISDRTYLTSPNITGKVVKLSCEMLDSPREFALFLDLVEQVVFLNPHFLTIKTGNPKVIFSLPLLIPRKHRTLVLLDYNDESKEELSKILKDLKDMGIRSKMISSESEEEKIAA